MAEPKWKLQVEQLMACNCNWGCPCSFDAPPTYGRCETALAYRIAKGSYGGVALDGLKFILVAAWPKAIHLGHGRGVLGSLLACEADVIATHATLRGSNWRSLKSKARGVLLRSLRGRGRGEGPGLPAGRVRGPHQKRRTPLMSGSRSLWNSSRRPLPRGTRTRGQSRWPWRRSSN